MVKIGKVLFQKRYPQFFFQGIYNILLNVKTSLLEAFDSFGKSVIDGRIMYIKNNQDKTSKVNSLISEIPKIKINGEEYGTVYLDKRQNNPSETIFHYDTYIYDSTKSVKYKEQTILKNDDETIKMIVSGEPKIYAEPTIGSDIIATLVNGSNVLFGGIVEQSGNGLWVKVINGNIIGYVLQDFVNGITVDPMSTQIKLDSHTTRMEIISAQYSDFGFSFRRSAKMV